MKLLERFGVGAWMVTAVFLFSMTTHATTANAEALIEPGSLDDKVGFYQLGDGRRALMTYSVKGGMRLYHLDDGVHRWRNDLAKHIYPGDGDHYNWEMNEGLPSRTLRFRYDGAGDIEGFSWTSESGETGTATRDNDSPYAVNEVSFFNGDTELSGTLLTPVEGSITGGAVIIHGSGDSHRDNLWYFMIADRLARKGIVTLLPDKRGSGKSKGEWQVAGFVDFAGDAIAGVHIVRAATAIAGSRVGLVGISQGGWIAPLVADMDQSIAYVVNLSGAMVTPSEQLVHETGVFGAPIAKLRRRTWWKKNGDFDPVPYWISNPQPSLIMYGSDDEQDNVPVIKSTKIIKEIQRQRDDLTLKVYQGVGHSLADPETGEMIFLDDMTDWILESLLMDN